jgi:tetratricopeptide (TPR) repeat protein
MRKTFIITLCGIAVLLAGYVGYRSYTVWKCSHLMGLAHQFLAQSDGRNALLCVQQVLRSDPQNLDATRVMAQLTEATRSPSALVWRNRVVELDPHSLADRLALAQTALLLRDYPTATNALEGVAATDRKTAAYHNIAGAVAAAAGQRTQAEAHFVEAVRLEPQNPELQLNLAVVRLHGTNLPAIAEARATLKQIGATATNSFLRCQALRELASYAFSRRQADEALLFSKQLLQETNSTFGDRLLRLEVLQETRHAEFKPALTAYQLEAAADPGKILELATWQMAKTSPQDALAWLRTLPPNTQTNQSVELLVAECCTMLKDWRGLQATIEKQNWGGSDFVRHAFLSRALRGQELADSAKAEWELALKGANGQKGSLVMLLRLAAQWNWQSEGEEILWTIVNRYPGEPWAIQGLTQALYAGGRTRSLMRLFSQEAKRVPAELSIKNNLAMCALLLDAQELKPYDLAREVYQKSPTTASYVSTYAFSLYLQGKNAEALQAMKTLKPQELQDPSISGYYGLILKATGDRAKARVYLDWAAKGQLLPEEKKLFDQAKTGL